MAQPTPSCLAASTERPEKDQRKTRETGWGLREGDGVGEGDGMGFGRGHCWESLRTSVLQSLTPA